MEIGAFEKPLNEVLLEEILSRDLYDATFDHLVLKDPVSIVLVHDQGRVYGAIHKVFSNALLSKYKMEG